MNEITDPLDYRIQCCESAINTGKRRLTKFTILNAKNELSKLRQTKKDLAKELFDANQSLVEEINRDLAFKNVAWATINGRGDMFNISMIYNQYADPKSTIPLYRNEKEYKEKYGKLSK